jgi:putative transcriptional regulator
MSSADSFSLAKQNIMNTISGEIIFSKRPGEALKKWRVLFEVSQAELAKHMGISPSVLSDYEKNRRASPGTGFIRKFVTSLILIDEARGGSHIRRFGGNVKDLSSAILKIAEFTTPKTAGQIAQALDGVWLSGRTQSQAPIYGYTVVDSLQTILNLDSYDFMRILGANTMRVVVFTGVTRGRSPIVAAKIYPIRPRMIAIHGPSSAQSVDTLAIHLAESMGIPFILSLKKDVPSLIKSLSEL